MAGASAITPRMAEVLSRNRESLNARFAMLRKSGAAIDGAAVLSHLRDAIAPIIDAVAAVAPEAADRALHSLYEVSLELIPSAVLGPAGRFAAVNRVWRELLPTIPQLLARDTQIIAASLSNAAFNLSQNSGARPLQWLSLMLANAQKCDTSKELLDAGTVAAWRAGMPQYRRGAIEAARSSKPAIVAGILDVDETRVATVLDQMKDDRWLSPLAAVTNARRELRLVRRVGAFRGFGGEFVAPPHVWQDGDDIFAADGESQFQVICDCFGTAILPHNAPPSTAPPPPVDATFDGTTLRVGADSALLPQLQDCSSIAQGCQAVAITLATSHHIFLCAKCAEDCDAE